MAHTTSTTRRWTIPHQGKRLRRALAGQHQSQAWLADRLGVTRQQITKWVQARSWEVRTTYKVAKALGVAPAYFLNERSTR